jgi:hypothetical protein
VNHRKRNNLPEPGVLSCVEAALSVGMHAVLHISLHGERSEVSQDQLVVGIQGFCSEFRGSMLRCDPLGVLLPTHIVSITVSRLKLLRRLRYARSSFR